MASRAPTRGVSRLLALGAAAITAMCALSGSASATTPDTYTGNISAKAAISHLIRTGPRAPEVVSARFRWTGSVMVLRVRVVRANPYRHNAHCQLTQVAALDIFVGHRERMTDSIQTNPGGPEGYSCGSHGTDVIGKGTTTNYTTNTYVFRIPRSAFERCGVRAGQTVQVLADSMMQIDNSPSGTNPWLFGAWAAEWSPDYSFKL